MTEARGSELPRLNGLIVIGHWSSSERRYHTGLIGPVTESKRWQCRQNGRLAAYLAGFFAHRLALFQDYLPGHACYRQI